MYIHNSNHSHDDYKSARHTQRQLALALLAPKPWWLRRTRGRVMGIPVFLYFPIIAVVFLTYLCPISLVLFPGARWFRVPSLPSGDNGITHCPGYHAFSFQQTLPGQFTVDLGLHGTPCSIYGQDIPLLKLEVTYQSSISCLSIFAWSWCVSSQQLRFCRLIFYLPFPLLRIHGSSQI